MSSTNTAANSIFATVDRREEDQTIENRRSEIPSRGTRVRKMLGDLWRRTIVDDRLDEIERGLPRRDSDADLLPIEQVDLDDPDTGKRRR